MAALGDGLRAVWGSHHSAAFELEEGEAGLAEGRRQTYGAGSCLLSTDLGVAETSLRLSGSTDNEFWAESVRSQGVMACK